MTRAHPAHGPPDEDLGRHPGSDVRTVMVFLRDLHRDLGTGYKMKLDWVDGRFDPAPWREGRFRCDCVRGRMLYTSGSHSCGRSRFVVERIVTWEEGETVYSECGLD